MDVFNAPDHFAGLRKAFVLYAAKNKFVAKDARGDVGLDLAHLANTHLDLGELQILLKAVHLVPRWITVEKVHILFYQHVR